MERKKVLVLTCALLAMVTFSRAETILTTLESAPDSWSGISESYWGAWRFHTGDTGSNVVYITLRNYDNASSKTLWRDWGYLEIRAADYPDTEETSTNAPGTWIEAFTYYSMPGENLVTFKAYSNGATLEANTDYWVVLGTEGASACHYEITATEDAVYTGSMAGYSYVSGDNHYAYSESYGEEGTWTYDNVTSSIIESVPMIELSTTAPTPEPATLALLTLGAAALLRKRKK